MSQKIEQYKDYPTIIDLDESTLDENTSIKKQLNFIEPNKKVVDFGCATGYFSKLMTQRRCIVTGVEINQKAAELAKEHCENVIIADLDFSSVSDILKNQIFDIAVFGDILEHLRNPWKTLQETKEILSIDGYVIASIPNVAHGAIRLALMNGKFEYQDFGILDNTHLRFFTRQTVKDLFEDSGYLIEKIDTTTLPLFSNSELVPTVSKRFLEINNIKDFENQEDIDTLQFIVKAVPTTIERQYFVSKKERNILNDKLEQCQSQLHQTQSELQQSQSQLHQTQLKLTQYHNKMEIVIEAIGAIQTSKFWKLRQVWFYLKSRFLEFLKSSKISQSNLSKINCILDQDVSKINDILEILEILDIKKINWIIPSHSCQYGSFDEINNSSQISHSLSQANGFELYGWAIIDELNKPADLVIITQGENESIIKLVPVNLNRSDVSQSLSNKNLETSGWKTLVFPNHFDANNISIKAWAYNIKSQEAFLLDKIHTIHFYKNIHQKNTFENQSNGATHICSINIESIVKPPLLVKHTATVDIIVCIHNALEDVRACLESIIRYTADPYFLILVDDGSNTETKEYLNYFSQTQNMLLITNEIAKGYTFAANQGLQKSKSDYSLLLNSDTIVTPNWLERMIACGESDSKIGVIGPLSNTASWQSIPQIANGGDWAENLLPEGISIEDMGKIVAKFSHCLYPRIPFINGFCFMIKRQVLEEVGYFDEENFGAGYGEENDFCLRTRKAGWELAIADDVYIYHSQSRSYSHERRKLLCERAGQALISKHGHQIVNDGVAICQYDKVLQGIRARTQVMYERQELIEHGRDLWKNKKILFILPICDPGGGGNVVLQEADVMRKMGLDVQVLNWRSHKTDFEKAYPDSTIPIVYADNEQEVKYLAAKFDAVVATLYKSVYCLQSIDLLTNPPVKGYYIQDFEPYFFEKDSEEFKIAWNSYTLYSDLIRFTKTTWNQNIVQNEIGVNCSIVEPSVNIDLFRPRNRKLDQKLRIAAMVRFSSERRSPQLTMEVLKAISDLHHEKIEIIIFGSDSRDLELIDTNFSFYNAGILTRPQLAFLLNEIDIFIDFSTYQAMGLTAMEAMACGAAVILPEKGGANHFAKNGENSLIIDTVSKDYCIHALNQLIEDEDLRFHLQQQAISRSCCYYPEKAAFNILQCLFEQ